MVFLPDSTTYNHDMRYEEPVYRPPSEAGSYLLQATIGCSWNHCTYCAIYREKQYRVRPLAEILEDIAMAGQAYEDQVRKVFVLDGDALAMDLEWWEPILQALSTTFPKLRRVSCYATALNLLAKSEQELRRLCTAGLKLLYIGPESGDDVTLKRIAKGATAADHVEAAAKAKAAGLKQSLIFLLGAGGTERSVEHATGSARLATVMDPEYLSALTLMLIPSTPIHKLAASGRFELPDITGLLRELRIIVSESNPSQAIFRANHASNYLPIGGRLPRDRVTILQQIDAALTGDTPVRAEWSRGL
ncbi:MAG: B12-binding domain-containing radical SAM protein [Planctomycetes bacterium]|nr:B12-binding domain-containing radical SAM protein [Planctomycetota bacterium]